MVATLEGCGELEEVVNCVSQENQQVIDLTNVPTCDLHKELIRREGISSVFLGPEDELRKVVSGPAWVIVNRD